MDTRKLFTTRFDIEGSESLRVTRTLAMSKIVPLGSFDTGPDARCLVVLTILHYFGRPLFWLFVRQEQRMRRVYHLLKRILGK